MWCITNFQTRKRKAKDGSKTGSELKKIKTETRELKKKSMFFISPPLPHYAGGGDVVCYDCCTTMMADRDVVRFYILSRALHYAQHISRLLLIRR